jgi:hypothetical protein
MSASAPAILRRAAIAIEEAVALLEAPSAPIASATPVVGSVIPAISPFFAADYDRVFNESVTYRSPNGDPLYGTIGASWRIHEDLRPIAIRLGNNRAALIQYVMKDAHYEPIGAMPARPTKNTASQLVDIFLFFNDPKQEFFFIKKGTSCQWLVRKTTGYFYASPFNGVGMAHRVGFQVIRKTTVEESVNQLGRGMSTWMKGGMKVSA